MNMQNQWKVETHAHTAEVSLCGKMPAAQMVRAVKDAGYDAVIVTDHYTPEFFEQHRTGPGFAARLAEYHAGYEAACKEGERVGLAVFPALEVRISSGPEDYLIYGVTPEELESLGCLAFLNLEELIKKVRGTKDGLLLQAHPFREYLTCQAPEMMDGVEVCNANPRHDSHNDRALAFAKEHGLLMTAGSDVHQVGDAGSAGVICPPFRDIAEFARLLAAGQTTWFSNRT
jgi:hypothetical protein